MVGLYNNLLDFLNTSGMYYLTCSDVFITVNWMPSGYSAGFILMNSLKYDMYLLTTAERRLWVGIVALEHFPGCAVRCPVSLCCTALAVSCPLQEASVWDKWSAASGAAHTGTSPSRKEPVSNVDYKQYGFGLSHCGNGEAHSCCVTASLENFTKVQCLNGTGHTTAPLFY